MRQHSFPAVVAAGTSSQKPRSRPAPASESGGGGLRARKSFGQNFLVDSSIGSAIVQQADVTPGDKVLEIGPGTGALTGELLKSKAIVTAVEADHSLVTLLQQNFRQAITDGQLLLIQGDATRLNLREVLMRESGEVRSCYKVVANLPFNITSEMLKILLPMGDIISDVSVMLQLEAALRLSGDLPGTSDYRAMSVLIDFYSSARMGMRINRTAFIPQPHVDCGMVHFRLKPTDERLPVPSEQAFTQLVNVCFSSRRKLVKNNLKAAFPLDEVIAAMHKLGLSDKIRPQELGPTDYAALARELNSGL